MARVVVQRYRIASRTALFAAFVPLVFGIAGAGAQSDQPQAQATPPVTVQPPKTAPGAAPSAARLVGTWVITQSQGGPADGRSDRSESTTYRFEDGGRVTVAGSKQCAYILQEAELKVDCSGRITAGRLEFRDAQTIVWTLGAKEAVTLMKR
jgi:hypothetical protein